MASGMSASVAGVVLGLGLAFAVPVASAQSDVSQVSGASALASVFVPIAAANALSEGAGFVVSGVRASGRVVHVTLTASAEGASIVVEVSAATLAAAGLAVGTVVAVTVLSTGWLIQAGGETIAFIANEATRRHVHSRRLAS